MEHIAFERPREKIQNYGTHYLTVVELLQVIIGSGGPRSPGGRLARKVSRLLEQGNVSYETLIAMYGLGSAKTCQILAALELGRRLATHTTLSKNITIQSLLAETSPLTGGSLYCYWLDGSGSQIDSKAYPLKPSTNRDAVTKHLFADAIAASARSIYIVLAVRHYNRQPTSRELSLLLAIKEAAHTLRVTIAGMYAASQSGYKSWENEL